MATVPQPRSRYFDVKGFEVHVTEWGERGAQPLVMWHGLARNGRDFDAIASSLAQDYNVICPDTIGRGFSQWSSNPESDYCFATYAQLAEGILDAAGVDHCMWLGTSMGGSLGVLAGVTTLKDRIERLIINDIGPTFPKPPYERIKAYVGNPPDFATVREMESYFREIYAPFGAHTDVQWRHMTETLSRRLPSGRFTTHYDPAIIRQLFAHPQDFEMWDAYDALDMPTLVLHGTESDLLLPAIAEEMTGRGPGAKVVEIPGCGHAPGLVQGEHIEIVRRFLDA